MATPHVAGLVALVLQRVATNTPGIPSLTPLMVKKLLEESCEPLPLTPNQAGYGLVNAYGALMRAAAVSPKGLAVGATS